jgi:hypothetical protein
VARVARVARVAGVAGVAGAAAGVAGVAVAAGAAAGGKTLPSTFFIFYNNGLRDEEYGYFSLVLQIYTDNANVIRF